MHPLLIKVFDFIPKIIEPIVSFLFPEKLKEIQIRIRRISTKKMNQVEEFIELYNNAFPEDGTNYTSKEMLELLEDLQNLNKHVAADNIILIAQYKSSLIGFIICHYYPKKKYGIISYFAKDKDFKDEEKFVSTKLLKELKEILLEHRCELIVFELQTNKNDEAKSVLFKLYAKSLELTALKLNFDYYRPKLNLIDGNEEKLILMIAPLTLKLKSSITKKKLLDILNFIHFYCYGDYYDKNDQEFETCHKYLTGRINYYDSVLSDKISAK